ncbi:hypothetical protein Ddye_020356 [Dipteronia dyeriana]|uniref:Acyl carrier protein n=1 Tax=Dipteronia dyeriana TaxID=168575 RepID=A0AAD9TZL1_9ROSI|nr:hypothetical protein Ddye_020356 [Dipteronia dyeriana]
MAAFLATHACSLVTVVPVTARVRASMSPPKSFSTTGGPIFCGQKFQFSKAVNRSFTTRSGCFKTAISCSTAQPETLKTVQSTVATKLSIELNSVTPGTKFADLGADSLDTVEIMMALEEQFGVSIGEDVAQNIATVQDAADLIEKVKVATA